MDFRIYDLETSIEQARAKEDYVKLVPTEAEFFLKRSVMIEDIKSVVAKDSSFSEKNDKEKIKLINEVLEGKNIYEIRKGSRK